MSEKNFVSYPLGAAEPFLVKTLRHSIKTFRG